MKFPDYDRGTLSLSASILNFYGAESGYPALPELNSALREKPTRNVVLLLLDGMGENLLKRKLPEDAFLVKNDRAVISAVYPSTTTAATTSLWTGVSPLEHGWLGWSLYFKECGREIDTFLNRDSFTGDLYPGPNAAQKLMPFTTMYTHLKGRVETHAIFPFPSYATNGADVSHVSRDLEDTARLVSSLCAEPGKKLICVYNGEPDHTMHERGVESEDTQKQFERVNRIAESLGNRLSEDTLLIVTADHGLVDVKENVILNEIPALNDCLWMPPFIEMRAASFFVKPHRKEKFEREFQAVFGEDFLLVPREEVFRMNLLGRGEAHPKCDDFVGDYLACATGERSILYQSLTSKKCEMIGQHAGLTDDEMTVPVILWRAEQK